MLLKIKIMGILLFFTGVSFIYSEDLQNRKVPIKIVQNNTSHISKTSIYAGFHFNKETFSTPVSFKFSILPKKFIGLEFRYDMSLLITEAPTKSGGPTIKDLTYHSAELGIRFYLSDQIDIKKLPVEMGSREYGTVSYVVVPSIVRLIHTLRAGLMYDKLSRNISDPYDIWGYIPKMIESRSIYFGTGIWLLSKIAITLQDGDDVDNYGKNKSEKYMHNFYFDLLYETSYSLENTLGFRAGLNLTNGGIFDWDFSFGKSSGNGWYVKTGIGFCLVL